MNRTRFLMLAIAWIVPILAPAARAQWTVFDPQNYAQNLLEASRALEQINHQIHSLQNEALMLRNMAADLDPLKTLSPLRGMVSSLTQITSLMNQAEGVAHNVDAAMTAWSQVDPSVAPPGSGPASWAVDAQQRWRNSIAAFQGTLKVQSQVVENVQADTVTLERLVGDSQGATGNLAVSQATNQLIALSTKQQLQIQSLMGAQYRATVLEQARNAAAEQDGQVQFQTFLGSKSAYTPQ